MSTTESSISVESVPFEEVAIGEGSLMGLDPDPPERRWGGGNRWPDGSEYLLILGAPFSHVTNKKPTSLTRHDMEKGSLANRYMARRLTLGQCLEMALL